MSAEPASPTRRPIPMRHTLGILVAALAVMVTTGCGDSSSTATDPGDGPASDPAGVPSRSPGLVEGAHVLPLISMTGAGGRAQPTATLLNSRPDIQSFAQQFRVPAMSRRLESALRGVEHGPNEDVVGQIVAVGCDRPPGVDVMADAAGDIRLVPHEVASPLEECLAAVTTVAVAVLPRG